MTKWEIALIVRDLVHDFGDQVRSYTAAIRLPHVRPSCWEWMSLDVRLPTRAQAKALGFALSRIHARRLNLEPTLVGVRIVCCSEAATHTFIRNVTSRCS
jgi:hypothetical protein